MSIHYTEMKIHPQVEPPVRPMGTMEDKKDGEIPKTGDCTAFFSFFIRKTAGKMEDIRNRFRKKLQTGY